jgi:hypothetical protein
MAGTFNLKEIANKFAKKQPQMVDDLTEMTPILERLRWQAASHGMWNQAEKVNDIDGAQFVNADAPLPTMNVSADLEKIDLQVLGGEMEQAEDTIDQFGGAAPYFASKEPLILKQAGMDTEVQLYYNNWIAKAIDDGNAQDAGASSGTTYSIVAIRLEEGVNIGLFDPTQFNQGTLLVKAGINGGNRYHLRSKTGVVGYGVTMKGRFGWQNLSTRNVACILNINTGNKPTEDEIDDMLHSIRATNRDSLILCHPKAQTKFLGPFKSGALQMNVRDTEYNRIIATWNEIPVVTSYNILDGTETVTAGL